MRSATLTRPSRSSRTKLPPLPWQDVNAVEAATVAPLVGLERSREPRKWSCPGCKSSDALHVYPGPGAGSYCWSACDRAYSNVDLAAVAWNATPADACKGLADALGIPTSDTNGSGDRPVRPVIATKVLPVPEPDPFEALRADGYVPQLPENIYAALLETLPLSDRGATYLEGRGFDPDHARAYGFRSLDGPRWWDRQGEVLAESWLPVELEVAGLYQYRDDALRYCPPWGGKAPALVIPYLHRGKVPALRFRRMDNAERHKYHTPPGTNPELPFGADALEDIEGRTLHIVEGEINAYALTLHGLRAVGIPGAGIWRPDWTDRVRPAARLVAWYDDDAAGRKGAGKLAKSLNDALGRAWVHRRGVRMTTPKDAADLHRDGELNDLVEQAPWRTHA